VELEQSRDEQQTIKHRADELDRTCRNTDAEKETLKSTIESMERALEQKEAKIERSLKDMVSLKEDMDRRLFDKDEELQNMRYAKITSTGTSLGLINYHVRLCPNKLVAKILPN